MAQEILELKAKVAKLEADLLQGRQLMMSLREQLDKLQKERDEYQQIAEQACSVSAQDWYGKEIINVSCLLGKCGIEGGT